MKRAVSLTKGKNNLRIRLVIRTHSKFEWVLFWPVLQTSTNFQENLACSFFIILLINKQMEPKMSDVMSVNINKLQKK